MICCCVLLFVGSVSVHSQPLAPLEHQPLGIDIAGRIVGKVKYVYANADNSSSEYNYVCIKNATAYGGTHIISQTTQGTSYFAFHKEGQRYTKLHPHILILNIL